jgi:hypothetical protein
MAGINRIKSPLANRPMPDLPPDDVQIAVKASHDMILEQLPDIVRKILFDELKPKVDDGLSQAVEREVKGLQGQLELNVKSLREDLMTSFVRVIQERFDRRFGEWAADNEASQKSFYDVHTKSLSEMTEAVKKEKGLASAVGEILKKEIGGDVSNLVKAYDNRLTGIEDNYHKAMVDAVAIMEKELDSRWKTLTKTYEARVESVEKALDAKIGDRQAEYQKAISQLIEAVGSIKPQVHVTNDVRPSDVTVNPSFNVPELHPQFNVPASEVRPQFTVPTQEVNIHNVLPDNPIQVKVEAMLKQEEKAKKRTRKSILYDSESRPAIIEEEEVD